MLLQDMNDGRYWDDKPDDILFVAWGVGKWLLGLELAWT